VNAIDLVFSTDRFNLSKVEAHFVNPCCFGEDLAAWIRGKLLERGVGAFEPYQEDWGWELQAGFEKNAYYLGVGGNSDDGVSNRGEWRIIIEKRRSVWDRLAGRGRIARDDRMVRLVEEILASQPDFHDIHREKDET